MPFGLTNTRLVQKVLKSLNPGKGCDFLEVYICWCFQYYWRSCQALVLEQRPDLSWSWLSARWVCDYPRDFSLTLNMYRDYPSPESVSQGRQFLGMTSYYRRFIEGFAKTCAISYLWQAVCTAYPWFSKRGCLTVCIPSTRCMTTTFLWTTPTHDHNRLSHINKADRLA